MKYCVVKNTTIVIDGSKNSEKVMIQNAINANFNRTQIEIITEEEYKKRVIIENSNVAKEPTEQEIINSQLLKENAAQKLINSDLLKQIAEIKGGTINVNV